MSRDYQRSRIYAWEDRHIHPRDRSVIPFEQAQSIVNYVWTGHQKRRHREPAAHSDPAARHQDDRLAARDRAQHDR